MGRKDRLANTEQIIKVIRVLESENKPIHRTRLHQLTNINPHHVYNVLLFLKRIGFVTFSINHNSTKIYELNNNYRRYKDITTSR